TAIGATGAATAAVLPPGTVNLVPSLSLADESRPLARASSATGMRFLRAMLASVSPRLTKWVLGGALTAAIGFAAVAATGAAATGAVAGAGAGAAAVAAGCGMMSCWPGESARGPL